MCYTQGRSGLIEPRIGLFLAAKDLRGPVLDQLGIPRPSGHLFHEHLPSMNWMEARAVLEQLDHSGFRELGPQKGKIEVPASNVNLRSVSALKSKGFLGTVTTSGDKIKAKTKRTNMTELTGEEVGE